MVAVMQRAESVMTPRTLRSLEIEMYSCKTCGKVTTDQGHLCDPKEIKRAYVCEYCGVTSSNPRHICKPKVAKIKYTCEACGRVAVDEGLLCRPKEIR
jgi:uncharacterized Zn finger protein